MLIHWQSPFAVGGTRSVVRLADGSLLAAHAKHDKNGVAVWSTRSVDQGHTWVNRGRIAFDPEPTTDLGDGALLVARDGAIYYTYRHNHYQGDYAKKPDYAIRVAVSRNNGKQWQPHSTVTEHLVPNNAGPSQGLWAPYLLETPNGRLQCYFDDEKTPLEAGFRGHQWIVMRTWNSRAAAWEDPTVVSRANNPSHLSRDGMATVVALPSKRLLCVLESVRVTPPHANVVRYVLSDDGGKTWNWRKQERGVVYQPKDPTFPALCPCLIRLANGTLVCVFCTDEDRATPARPGSSPPEAHWDVKITTSRDNGKTWSRPETVTDSHRTYLPGIVEIRPNQLLATWIDFARGGTQGKVGELSL